jgi:hypothetical protein
MMGFLLFFFISSPSYSATAPRMDAGICQGAIDAAAQKVVELSNKRSVLKIFERKTPVSLSEITGLIHRVKEAKVPSGGELNPFAAYVEIVKLKEVKNTYIAFFNKQKFMNLALDRASNFIEDSNKMTSQYEMLHGARRRDIAGHDLKGRDLVRFRTEYESKAERMLQPKGKEDLAYLQIEEDFWQDFLEQKLIEEPNLILIASSAMDEAQSDISHEILHAVFFHHKKYRQFVAEFWNSRVTGQDKAEIRKILASDYDEDNVILMENEFQAYILEKDADEYDLHKFVKKYHHALIRFLESKGFNFEKMDFQKNKERKVQ